jgi:hypothetical protein
MSGPMARCFLPSYQIVGSDINQSSNLKSIINKVSFLDNQTRIIITCDSKRLQSIQTPLLVCCRDIRAAIMAPCAYSPVAMSVAATPTLTGGRPGSPVLCMANSMRKNVTPLSDIQESAFYGHVHKTCFALDNHVVACSGPVWSSLTIT